MKNFVVLLLAGNSTRFANDTKKQFYLIKDKPVLYYSLNTFNSSKLIDEIVLVIAKDDEAKIEKIVKQYKFAKVKQIVLGGDSRQESVFNGLNAIKENEGKVLIHDAARPLVDDEIIEKLISKLDSFDGASPALKVVDTIIKVDNNELDSYVDRDNLYRIQTPQAFKLDIIKKAHVKFQSQNLTDDTQLVKLLGGKIAIIEGKERLQKITKLEDTNAIEAYIEKNEHLQN